MSADNMYKVPDLHTLKGKSCHCRAGGSAQSKTGLLASDLHLTTLGD